MISYFIKVKILKLNKKLVMVMKFGYDSLIKYQYATFTIDTETASGGIGFKEITLNIPTEYKYGGITVDLQSTVNVLPYTRRTDGTYSSVRVGFYNQNSNAVSANAVKCDVTILYLPK